MNIRKNIDYSEMYENLDKLMAQQLPQMDLYCEIGKAVCRRTEKGAGVMASEYLNRHYPDVKGFSPRNLRRMRDFYRTYEKHSALLRRAMKLGWIQNVVIMEADLTMELREWYMKAAKQFDWSKTEVIANIAANAHESIDLAIEKEAYYVQHHNKKLREIYGTIKIKYGHGYLRKLCQKVNNREGKRLWLVESYPIFVEKKSLIMRC